MTAALDRERELHDAERGRWEERVRDLEAKVQTERLHDVRRTTSELEEQLVEAQTVEEQARTLAQILTMAAMGDGRENNAAVN